MTTITTPVALDDPDLADEGHQAELLAAIRALDSLSLVLLKTPPDLARFIAERRPTLWLSALEADPAREILLKEQATTWDVSRLVWHRKELRSRIRKLGNVFRQVEALEVPIPTELLEVRTRAEQVLVRVEEQLRTESNLARFAERRRLLASDPADKHAQHSIGPGAKLTAIRRWYIPRVTRRVRTWMVCLTPGLAALGHQITQGTPEPGELERFVNGGLNKLTAAFVRAYYPVWSAGVTQGEVGTTERNTRKNESRRKAKT